MCIGGGERYEGYRMRTRRHKSIYLMTELGSEEKNHNATVQLKAELLRYDS